MADTKITLMAFEPKPLLTTRVYTLGLPAELRDLLFDLMPGTSDENPLATKKLKGELRCWLDDAVELNPAYRGKTLEDWLIALKPINLVRFCNVVAEWLSSECRDERREYPAYQAAMAFLRLENFKEYLHEKDVRLFRDDGSPEPLAFAAFSASVSDAIVGKPFDMSCGVSLVFSRLSSGTSGAYELVSNVRWHGEDPYSIVLKFSVQTLPVGRKARLNVDVSVRPYITATWQTETRPHMSKDVCASVRMGNGVLRGISYGYNGKTKRLEWDASSRRLYEEFSGKKLPELDEYIAHMADYVADGASLQILSPHSTAASWAKRTSVKNGMSMVDRAMVHDVLREMLADYAVPLEPLSSVGMNWLNLAIEDGKDERVELGDPVAVVERSAWQKVNRRRLAQCTGERRVTFELIGSSLDASDLDQVRARIWSVFGEEDDENVVDIRVKTVRADGILSPLKESGDAGARMRWREIGQMLDPADGLTACIVVLPSKDAFGKSNEKDPKQAIRIGLAKTGRLSQFLVPSREEHEELRRKADAKRKAAASSKGDVTLVAKEKTSESEGGFAHRVRMAVMDLMRQMGFVQVFKPTRAFDTSMPLFGLRVYRAPLENAYAEFPILVGMRVDSGAVTARSPLFFDEEMPYWKAQLELACVSSGPDYREMLKRISGHDLYRMVDHVKDEACDDALMFVHSYGVARFKRWWPGISDISLADGVFRYGPRSIGGVEVDDMPFEQGESKLRIVRVRASAHGEVPGYFTERKLPKEGVDSYVGRCCDKCGIFLMDGYALCLGPKPGTEPYKRALRSSKFERPGQLFDIKGLTEYFLLTGGSSEDLLYCARLGEALRRHMVQASTLDPILPAPLHLAEKMDEYVWDWDKSAARFSKK